MKDKSICIIPARGGSKGIPKKNIRPLGGKPLIAHAIESALDSNLFDHVVVTTDDEEIAKISKDFGAEIPFMRPSELSRDTTSTDEVLNFCIPKLQSIGFDFDIFALRDCTVPFINKSDMSGSISLLKQKKCDGVFAAIKAHPNPYFGMMETNEDGFLIPSKLPAYNVVRRQDAPLVWIVDGLFVFYADKFLTNKLIYKGKILPYEIPKIHAHMIDFELDFQIAEFLYHELHK
jgi:CMP-N-acetylneuraminic acid synthetase